MHARCNNKLCMLITANRDKSLVKGKKGKSKKVSRPKEDMSKVFKVIDDGRESPEGSEEMV